MRRILPMCVPISTLELDVEPKMPTPHLAHRRGGPETPICIDPEANQPSAFIRSIALCRANALSFPLT